MRSAFPAVRQKGFLVLNASNSIISTHSHQYLELAYIQQGNMEHHIHGQAHLLKPGDYFIVDYGVTHSYKRIGPEKLLVRNFLFLPEFLDKGLTGTRSFQDVMNSYLLRFCYRTLRSSPTGITFHDEDGRIKSLLDEISEEFTGEDYGYLEFIRCAFVKVLILTMRKIGGREKAPEISELVSRITEHAQHHYKEKLRLNALAKQLGYNAAYLSQRFSAEMGISFMEYLHKLRIERSCHLLSSTNLKVSRIAQEVGYEGMKYFNAIFKKRLGLTPSQFRSMNRKTGG